MSAQGFEVIHRGIAAYNRRDIEGMLENWTADAIIDWSRSRGPDAGVYRGQDEIRRFTEGFVGAFDEVRIEFGQPSEIATDTFLVENVAHMRGRGGIEVQARSFWIFETRDGMVTGLTLFQSESDALEALAH